jgi:bacterioferritin B
VSAPRFADALNTQIGVELAASHQYVAVAVHYDAASLPRLAQFFYDQALEERDHALMMVRYLLDTGTPVSLSEISAPQVEFPDHVAPIELALEQEREVTGRIGEISLQAREERDYRGEQFLQWFLREQVEEEATMSELLDVAKRVRDFPMTLEEFIAREHPGGEGEDPTAPARAGSRR